LQKLVKILVTVLTLSVVAEPIIAGRYADAMFHLGVSPRNSALGNAGGSLIQNGSVFLHNPANISYLKNPELAAMYVSQFGMADYNILGLSMPISKSIVVGLHWMHFGVENIPLRPDLSGYNILTQRDSARTLLQNPLGSFSDKEDAVFISIAKMFRWNLDLGWRYFEIPLQTPIGINIKYLNRELYRLTGSGVGLDLSAGLKFGIGELFDADWMGTFGTSLLWQDVTNTAISWSSYSQDVMHSNLQLYYSYEQPVNFMHSSLSWVYTQSKAVKGGAKFGFEVEYKNRLSIQAGYHNHRWGTGISVFTKIWKFPLSIEYAFSPHVLGNSHRIGITVGFHKSVK